MVTLTYDSYLRDAHGNLLYDRFGVPLELPPDRKRLCSKRDVQLFVKRLRAKFGGNIKYLITAEHGKRTHRAHYHALLFGVSFPDLFPYKKSDRGNQIFRSKVLEKLWKHGICTVDSVNVYGSMARYVTKYSMKERGVSDTFQLFSRGIGSKWLFEHFTGRPYIIEGRAYAVPRLVWNWYIMQKYGRDFPITDRYVNRDHEDYEAVMNSRHLFSAVRNSDDLYAQYVVHQSKIASDYELTRLPVEARVAALDSKKYFYYKAAWYRHKEFDGHALDPFASDKKRENFQLRIDVDRAKLFSRPRHLPLPSRQYTANDRILCCEGFLSSYDLEVFQKKSSQTLDNLVGLVYNQCSFFIKGD